MSDEKHPKGTIEERLVDAYGYLRDVTDNRGWRIPEKKIPEAYNALVTQLGLVRVKRSGRYCYSRGDVKQIERLGIWPVNPYRYEKAWNGYSQAAYEMAEHTPRSTGGSL